MVMIWLPEATMELVASRTIVPNVSFCRLVFKVEFCTRILPWLINEWMLPPLGPIERNPEFVILNEVVP